MAEWHNSSIKREHSLRGHISGLLDSVDVSDLDLKPAEGTILFASDLDHTLINSLRHVNMTSTLGLVSIETRGRQPFSFITTAGLEMLHILREMAVFSPVTSRTVEQFNRVHLPCDFAITTGGGMIVEEGKASSLVESVDFQQVRELGKKLKRTYQTRPWFKKCNMADDMFVYLVSESSAVVPHEVEQELLKIASELGYDFSRQGNKMYLVPPGISKLNGVEHLVDRVQPSYVIAAGDSALDFPMVEASDVFLAPRWGELYEQKTPGVRFVGEHTSHGVRTSEQLIATALKVVLTLRGEM